MSVLRAYYLAKPFLPWGMRVGLRRQRALWKRRMHRTVWPINEAAARKPEGWPGWPPGHQFAFVLTHDVECDVGLKRVREVAELEMALGFRSSFGFVPEGVYRVPAELREWLVRNDFEVAVHDLNHDGKLYQSRAGFVEKAKRINHYLREWNAAGFRAAFMLRQIEWLRDLNVEYDASTFDTDPFEPQPDGAHTIYPFWVGRPGEDRRLVELPYTLVQDFNLFIVLQEKTPAIWEQKLSWIAKQGGMALLDTHPDYMAIGGARPDRSEYPIELYEKFLKGVAERYAGQYWHALPRSVAAYFRTSGGSAPNPMPVKPALRALNARKPPCRKIWIDLDNTPHVPFFKPIIRELKARGHEVVVTARNAFQVCDLADRHGVGYLPVGTHWGKNRILKVLGLLVRAARLAPFAFRESPDLALSHGARSQILISNLLRIPTVLVMDYEHARLVPMARPRWLIVPDVIHPGEKGGSTRRVRYYPGIKEDVYAGELHPDPGIFRELGVDPGFILVTARPPATEAHYHNPESEGVFAAFMEQAVARDDVRVVLLPRNHGQEIQLRAAWPHWFAGGRVTVPTRAVDGMNLLWHSDLVVSGGGTMNREAAALGIPVFSVFRGPIGAVDRLLTSQGRLVLVESPEQARQIPLRRRRRDDSIHGEHRQALPTIVEHIESILGIEYGEASPGVAMTPEGTAVDAPREDSVTCR